jgi:hypothetical protein
MWFGFNFNDSFRKTTKGEYQKQLSNKEKTAKCKMISGIGLRW